MKAVVLATSLVVGLFFVSSSSAFSEEHWGLLTPRQASAYHACLFEEWIHDYCHWTSLAYSQCVIANGGGKYPLDPRHYNDNYCWYTAQGLQPPY